MRVLVTGANGLVGGKLLHELARRGHQGVGVSRGPRRREGPGDYVSAELVSPAQVNRAFDAHPPQAVIHTAALTELDVCEADPLHAWAQNVTATANVAQAAARSGAHLVHLSTDYVFDGASGPYREDALPSPVGVYPVTKHASEYAASVLAPGCAIARTAVVYGHPRSARMNFGMWLFETLSRGEQVRLFEDQLVSPSLADSVAEQLCELAELRLGGIWNICGGEVVTRVQFGEIFCDVFGLDRSLIVPTRLAQSGLTARRPPRAGLIADKARAELRAQPLPVREALIRFRDALRSAPPSPSEAAP